ncbi:hypothetical protein QZH41_009815, partial [Actinostola sp. cb2023]
MDWDLGRETERMDLAENVIKVNIDLNKKCKKELAGFKEALQALLALKNSSGGVIILVVKNKELYDDTQNRSNWILKFNDQYEAKLSELGEENVTDTDFSVAESEEFLIFVRKASTILTEESNLIRRMEKRNVKLKSHKEITNIFKTKSSQCCCVNNQIHTREVDKSINFEYGNQLAFSESKTIEFKYLTGSNLPKSLRKELRDYIVSFANTEGGTVYFGIKDDGEVCRQHVKDESELSNICHQITRCMNSKIWLERSGKVLVPREHVHYWYGFYQVTGALPDHVVIAVHVCQFSGAVFVKEPVCQVVNENHQIVKMEFQNWLSHHWTSDTSDRFEQRKCGSTVYMSIKGTVEEITKNLKENANQGELTILPEHVLEWIMENENDVIYKLKRGIQKHFQENNHQGYAFVEKCWNINLGRPLMKPPQVYCDVLLCSPMLPVMLLTICQSDAPEVYSYNHELATMLKRTLVLEAGCLDKFYIKPVVVRVAELILEDEHCPSIICGRSRSPYPDAYNMSEGKHERIIESLLLLLARAKPTLSYQVGQRLFKLLTVHQYEILNSFYGQCKISKVHITGLPGTGKTILALERIYRLRCEGSFYNQVLFMCSDKPLLSTISRMQFNDGKPLCKVITYAGLEFNGVYDLSDVKHVLADEFHSCTMEQFQSLRAMVQDQKNQLSVWIFSDHFQKIENDPREYSSHFAEAKMSMLQDFHPYRLTRIIRTTAAIHRFCERYMQTADHSDITLGHDLEGESVRILVPLIPGRRDERFFHILLQELHEIVNLQGHKAESVTVLFNNDKDIEIFTPMINEHNWATQNGEDELQPGFITLETVRRYSGNENNVIIGFCSPLFSWTNNFQDNDSFM